MIVYPQEIADGLEEKVKASASVAYASIVEPVDRNGVDKKNWSFNKSIASMEDSDLYYVQSILVTSSWNKNDDVFDKYEVWNARNTPEDKPTNLEHDENIIIGHITSNWPITEDGVMIDPATPVENLPEKFHILTGSVIYKGFSNPELKDRSEKLIAEIENGTKYVSMECYFKGFDYGLINKTSGEFKVLSRNAETSYLTKYLRSYGGLGEHEGYKIGRVLRDITFSGKGYVDKPANPDSIIFNERQIVPEQILRIDQEKNEAFVKAGVNQDCTNNTENNTMSLEKEVADLKSKVEAMTDCGETVKEAYSLASELKNQISILENTIAKKDLEISEIRTSLASEIEVSKNAYAELVSSTEAAKKMSEEEMMKKEEEMKKSKAELAEALEAIAAYKTKEAEMMKKEKKMKRMASLIENGVSEETATATLEKFENLDDEAFDAIANLLVSAAKSVKTQAEETTEIVEETKSTESEVLETAEVENTVDLSVGGEDDSVNVTRAALVDFVFNRLNKKNLNKGE